MPETVRAHDELWFWRTTGLFGRGHVTYRPGQLESEGPFTNPARMAEDCGEEFWADVWRCAGWWDPKHFDGDPNAH